MDKNLVLAISLEHGTGGGCWWHRVAQISNYFNENPQFNTKVIETPVPIFDPNVLMRTKCVFIQRPFSHMPWIRNYKELQPKYENYSIVFDVDDQFTTFGNEPGLPPYHPNATQPRDFNAIDRIIAEQLQYFDRGIVTTESLKKILVKKFEFLNVEIIPNASSRSLYNMPRKDFFRERPLCSIPAAKQHNREPMPLSPQMPAGQIGLRGDFDGAWVDWIVDKVTNNEIDFAQSAGHSYFFDCIAEKIQESPWFDVPNYIGYTCRIRPDIIFAPLDDNFFNKCKSSLRATQAFALGAILIASCFNDGPYEHIHPLCRVPSNPTKEQLNTIFNNVKSNWKEIIEWQYDYINKHGEWLESIDHINKYLTAFAPAQTKII